jgi:phosphatidylserine/phosphatidylglycerophosphate/cardiolipin synthase-like enzyme
MGGKSRDPSPRHARFHLHLRFFRDTYFRGAAFHVSRFSIQFSETWNQLQHQPTDSDPLADLHFVPDPDRGLGALAPVTSEFLRALPVLSAFLSPFAILLPSCVPNAWEGLGPFEPGPQDTFISRAMDDLTATVRPIAVDAGIPLWTLLRLDGLLNLQQVHIPRLRTSQTFREFFPVPGFLEHDPWARRD